MTPYTRTPTREIRALCGEAGHAGHCLRVYIFWVQRAGFNVLDSGCRAQGSGFKVQGSGFRVQHSGCRVQDSWFLVQGSGFSVQHSAFRAQGAGFKFRVQGAGFKVQGSGFRVKGSVIWRTATQAPDRAADGVPARRDHNPDVCNLEANRTFLKSTPIRLYSEVMQKLT